VAVLKSRMAVKMCGRQSGHESVLAGIMVAMWQFKN
jgi:hypothetical protein